jgi:RecB family exonuclease
MEQYSFSKLSSFHQCKYGYYLTYIAKEKGIENAFSQYGTFVHGLLERYETGELEVYELCDEFIKGYSDNVTFAFPPNRFVDLRESYFKDGVAYLENFDGFDEYEILAVEDEFLEDVDGDFNLKGFIDLVLRDSDGGITIIDHKSKAKFASKQEQKRYARQLYVYSLRVLRRWGVYPKKLIFNMFRKQKTVEIDFNEADYDESVSWMKSTVSEIRNCKSWNASPDEFMCNHLCNHREGCEFKVKK